MGFTITHNITQRLVNILNCRLCDKISAQRPKKELKKTNLNLFQNNQEVYKV